MRPLDSNRAFLVCQPSDIQQRKLDFKLKSQTYKVQKRMSKNEQVLTPQEQRPEFQ